jgi:hypothetical protein
VSSFYNGQLNYVCSTSSTCPASGVETTPTTGPNSLAALDPCAQAGGTCPSWGPGADPNLLGFLQTRPYPLPNNNAAGDGLNTSGYFFVAPLHQPSNTYIARIDYQATANHRVFARGTWENGKGGIGGVNVQVFPNDPNPSESYQDHSRALVAGDTRSIISKLITSLRSPIVWASSTVSPARM